MGTYKLSVLLDGIKGKVGNVVFQGKKTIRKKVNPANPKTTLQVASRAKISSFSKAWGALSESQRTAWGNAAKSGAYSRPDEWGEPFNPTGEQLYIEVNITASLAGGSAISNVPTAATFASITLGTLTLTATGSVMTQAFTGTLGANEQLVIFASGQVSAGRMSANESSYRVIGGYSGASPINFAGNYTTKYGTLAAGKKVFLRIEQINALTGQRQVLAVTNKIIA